MHLAQDKHLAASSIAAAVAALRFLYTVTLERDWLVNTDIPTCRQPHKLPNVLSREEVSQFLDAVASLKHRVILTVCYAAGLPVSEVVRLKPVAIDSQRMVIRVEEGKGRKDRYVMLSPKLLDILRDYWKTTRPKEWLFPGDRPGQPITRFAVECACRQTRLQCGIAKPVTPQLTAWRYLRRSPTFWDHCTQQDWIQIGRDAACVESRISRRRPSGSACERSSIRKRAYRSSRKFRC